MRMGSIADLVDNIARAIFRVSEQAKVPNAALGRVPHLHTAAANTAATALYHMRFQLPALPPSFDCPR